MLSNIVMLLVGFLLGVGAMWLHTAPVITRLKYALKVERGWVVQYRDAWMKLNNLPPRATKRGGEEVKALGGRWWIVE